MPAVPTHVHAVVDDGQPLGAQPHALLVPGRCTGWQAEAAAGGVTLCQGRLVSSSSCDISRPTQRGAAEAGHGGQLAAAHHFARRDL